LKVRVLEEFEQDLHILQTIIFVFSSCISVFAVGRYIILISNVTLKFHFCITKHKWHHKQIFWEKIRQNCSMYHI